MTAVLEDNGHRRPGPPRLTLAPHGLPASRAEPPELKVAEVAELGARLRASIRAGMRLPEQVLDVVVATLLAGGHLLVEDHPRVGKTQLARTLAHSLGGRFARVQATVDLLPADIVGASTYPLPAAQLDRFLARVTLGYPSADHEISLLRGVREIACRSR